MRHRHVETIKAFRSLHRISVNELTRNESRDSPAPPPGVAEERSPCGVTNMTERFNARKTKNLVELLFARRQKRFRDDSRSCFAALSS